MRIFLPKTYFLWPLATGGERSQTAVLQALSDAGCSAIMRYAVPPGLPQQAFLALRSLLETYGIGLLEDEPDSLVYLVDSVKVEAVRVNEHPGRWFGPWLDEIEPDMVLAAAKDTLFLPILGALWKGPGGLFVQDVESLQKARQFLRPASFSRFASSSWTIIASSEFLRNRAKDLLNLDSKVLYPLVMWDPRISPPVLNGPITMFGTTRGKGIDIFTKIAQRMPHRRFEAVMGWERTSPPPTTGAVNWIPFQIFSRRIIESSSIILVPSRVQEGFGRVVLEAMTCGKPVIVSDRGALSEAVGNAGTIVPIPDQDESVDAWVHAIGNLDDPAAYHTHAKRGIDRAHEIAGIRRIQFQSIFGAMLPD